MLFEYNKTYKTLFIILFMEDKNCLFCKILKGEIPSTKTYDQVNKLEIYFLDCKLLCKIKTAYSAKYLREK